MALYKGILPIKLLSAPLKKLSVSVISVRTSYFPRSTLPPILDLERLKTPLPLGDPYRGQKVLPASLEETTLFDYDPQISKFVHYLMINEKQKAQDVFDLAIIGVKRAQLRKYHQASDAQKPSIELNGRTVLKQAISNCSPVMGIRLLPRGGAIYKIPIHLSEKRSFRLGCMHIVKAVREERRTKIPFHVRLTSEILQASENKGSAVKKKQQLHKVCHDNRAYAHYRWR